MNGFTSFFLMVGLASHVLTTATAKARTEPNKFSDTSQTVAGHSESQSQATVLKMADAVRREIAGGEVQSFAIPITVGQFAQFCIEQHGSILLATLFDPQSNEVIQMDTPAGGHGPIYLSAVASQSGIYRLELRSRDKWANPSNYELTLETLRAAEPSDTSLVEAEQQFAEGRKRFRADKASEALKYYSLALQYWDNSGDQHWLALTHYALGEAYRNLGDREKSEQSINKALEIVNVQMAPNDWRLKASALNDLGSIYVTTKPWAQAIGPLNEALSLFVANNDRRGQASSLNNLARVQDQLGNLTLARELIEKALNLRKAENDQGGVANLLNALGAISDRLGEPEIARDYYTQALQVWKTIVELRPADRTRVAAVFNNLATASDKLGDWNQALNYYEKALDWFKEGDPNRAATLDNKGELFASLGDPKKAQECYNDALTLIAKSRPDLDVKANILIHIGQLYLFQGDISAALNSFEEARKVEPSLRKQADVFNNLGAAFSQNGDQVKALECYEKALAIQIKLQDHRGQALTHQNRGEAYAILGNSTEAIKDFNDAHRFWKALKDERGEAAALHGVALVEHSRQKLTEALENSNRAIAIIESLRTRLSSRQLRASYFANQKKYYELDIDLKMQLRNTPQTVNYLAAALESSEKARARVLLDMLNEAGVGRASDSIARDSDQVSLVGHRDELLRRLGNKAQARTRLLNGAHSASQIAIIDREMESISEKVDLLDVQIRSRNPRLAAITNPQPSTLKQIQQVLDEDTLLLEYALGKKRSYVWAISQNSIYGFELSGRDQIEALARTVNDALIERNRAVKNEDGLQTKQRFNRVETHFADASAELSKMVLAPVAPLLGDKRLIIVADGALQLVPFAALPTPDSPPVGKEAVPTVMANAITKSSANSPVRLIDHHEIVSLPSASVLVLQRGELANRKPARYAVAVLADPVYEQTDFRLVAASKLRKKGNEMATANSLTTKLNSTTPTSKRLTSNSSGITAFANETSRLAIALRDVGIDGGLTRLPWSAREAKAITRLIPRNQLFSAVGFKANRETATSAELSKYRFIHFATHGFVDFEHPELSGIVLSMFDEKGRPQDGYLRLHEIYNLNLPAELVVLSACQTGVGKQIKGEGLMALTRGFMYAGAKSIVASLWKVDDAATAELMEEFYNQMFTNRLKPAAAVRAAQIKMSQKKHRNSPYYWAGFFLQGDWN